VGLGIAVLVSALGSAGSTGTAAAPPATSKPGSSAAPDDGAEGTIYIHVLGAVAKPGLYLLRDGDRGVDAVASAGGFTPDADQSQVNLARVVVDGEQIVVPVIGAAAVPGEGPGASAGAASTVGGKVNINTADATALETLPRVGPAMSKRIIDWRTKNGRFTSVEDLTSITGIGEKTFEQLKDLVTV
jgi:competence protein ComEA